jgi:hypothetical protein
VGRPEKEDCWTSAQVGRGEARAIAEREREGGHGFTRTRQRERGLDDPVIAAGAEEREEQKGMHAGRHDLDHDRSCVRELASNVQVSCSVR